MKAEIYKEEGYRLMGAAFEVYNDQDYGLAEEIYQESLEIELELRSMPFRSKQELKCYYKGRELKKRYVPDLLVFGCLVVELKAVSQLLPEHDAQLINYLRITNAARRLPDQFRPQRHFGVETLHSLRVYPSGKLAQISAD